MDHRKFVLDHISEIEELLRFEYGSPNHFNKDDPLDELIFVMLSRQTNESSYIRAYNKLKKRFEKWEEMIPVSTNKIYRIIRKAGLGSKRAEEIQNNLVEIKSDFGFCSLDSLHRWNNSKVYKYLTSLDGVGPKIAYCVMMYSLKREVFPVDTHINIICKRLGLIDKNIEPKKGQIELADLFPISLRYSLHVNMLDHGRKVCTSSKPKCDECVISGFCTCPRMNNLTNNNPSFIDIFAGAGGMSLGFEKAGFNVEYAIEENHHACSTFLLNRSYLPASRIIQKRVEDVKEDEILAERIDIIISGPPCQEFSKVRKNSNKVLGRKELYKEVLRLVKIYKPLFVIIENVPGMASHVNKEYCERVIDGLRDLHYVARPGILNAKYFGIPQNRDRLFFIGRRNLTNSESDAKHSVDMIWERIYSFQKKDELINFEQGISGLPRLSAGEGADVMLNSRRGRRSDYANKLDCNGKYIFNHITRKHNERDLEAYRNMDEGENALDLHMKRPDLMRYSTDNFITKYFKIRRNTPSPTIVAHLQRDANSYINPFDNRGITPREAARLQSFPDSYRFLGSFGIQFEQIGNAVPPILAEIIGTCVKEEINANLVIVNTKMII